MMQENVNIAKVSWIVRVAHDTRSTMLGVLIPVLYVLKFGSIIEQQRPPIWQDLTENRPPIRQDLRPNSIRVITVYINGSQHVGLMLNILRLIKC